MGLAVVVGLNAEFQLDGQLADGVVFRLLQVIFPHHVGQHDIPAFQAVVVVGNGVVGGGCLEHAHQHGGLLCGKFFRGGVEIGPAGGLDAECVGAEVNGVGIHGQDLLFVVDGLELGGYDPLLRLHDEHLQARDVAQKTRRVVRTHLVHVLRQLLGDGRCTTSVMMEHGVFGGCQHAPEVDGVPTWAVVVTLVLRVDERLPERRIHLFVFDRCAVLVEEFSYQFAISTIYFGCLANLWFQSRHVAGRLAKEPKEIDIHHTQPYDEEHQQRYKASQQFHVPCASMKQVLVPMPETYEGLTAVFE